jgi:uncharacterized DUF497 family protein
MDFAWDPDKNEWLIEERGISFERVVFSIEHDKLLDVVRHPNPAKYPNQKMFIVEIDGYAYLIPFVESKKSYSLKTIIPSRKATRRYLGDA